MKENIAVWAAVWAVSGVAIVFFVNRILLEYLYHHWKKAYPNYRGYSYYKESQSRRWSRHVIRLFGGGRVVGSVMRHREFAPKVFASILTILWIIVVYKNL